MFLEVNGPPAVVGVQESDVGNYGRAAEGILDGGKFAANLRDLRVERGGSAVGSNQSAVVLFLSVERAAPLPVAHVVGTMRNCLPGHGSDLSLVQEVVDARPVDGAGLSLNHPEVTALEAARQVMGQTVGGWVEVSTADIIVPSGEGQWF